MSDITPEQAEKLAEENGWRGATFAEYYERRDVGQYPPTDNEIDIPSWAEENPESYREHYREGWSRYDEESTYGDEPESDWPYEDDPREK